MVLEVTTKLMKDIYSSGYALEDLLESIVTALPQKSGAIDCEEYRTFNLVCHVTNVLMRILMKRIRSKIKTENEYEQCGFALGKATTRATYILRTFTERIFEMNIHMCLFYSLH